MSDSSSSEEEEKPDRISTRGRKSDKAAQDRRVAQLRESDAQLKISSRPSQRGLPQLATSPERKPSRPSEPGTPTSTLSGSKGSPATREKGKDIESSDSSPRGKKARPPRLQILHEQAQLHLVPKLISSRQGRRRRGQLLLRVPLISSRDALGRPSPQTRPPPLRRRGSDPRKRGELKMAVMMIEKLTGEEEGLATAMIRLPPRRKRIGGEGEEDGKRKRLVPTRVKSFAIVRGRRRMMTRHGEEGVATGLIMTPTRALALIIEIGGWKERRRGAWRSRKRIR